MRKAILTLIILLILPGVCLGEGTTALRQQMAGYLRSGSAAALPDNHPLAALKRAPVMATVAWLLFHEDPSLLAELYPVIDETVMDYFSEERTDENNFIAGYWLDDRGSRAVCPGLNALAALDLHSLSLIASAAGHRIEAIELRKLSRDYSDAITDYFFDYTNSLFLPVAEDGSYAPVYQPGQLLPLILYRGIDLETRTRIAERLLYETVRSGSGSVMPLWDDPAARTMITSMLAGVDGFPTGRLERLPHSTDAMHVPEAWRSLWSRSEDVSGILFPVCDELFVLTNLTAYLGESRLMLKEKLEPLSSDLDTLTYMLSGDPIDLEIHIEAVCTANRMLASLSIINSTIQKNERIWKIFEEYIWNGLSRREQKMIAQAFSSSIDELLEAKRMSSDGFIRTTGFHADVRLPDRPVPAGRKIEMEARMWTGGIQLGIERVYLQAGANRWKFTEAGEPLELRPGAAPLTWQRALSIHPGSEPGLRSIRLFFDFMSGGKRVEIHSMASVILTSGYDISLNYPAGRRLMDDALPLNITVRYGTEHPIQGIVEGIFYRDLGCKPELPARFMIRENADITTLPLTIDPPESLPPGRYPFTLSVKIDGDIVAAFDDELVRPVRWLHLGPLPNRGWVIENATSLQSDLYGTHTLSDGRELRWSRVPQGAFDEYGSVIPDRLYGSGSDRCMMLYTVVTSDKRRKVSWKVRSDNVSNLWINEVPLLGAGSSGSSNSGVTMLREGRNSLLLSSAWDEFPDRVLLELSDENGLPLVGIGNDVDAVLRDFAMISETAGESRSAAAGAGQPREVTFTIDCSDASEISLIGEFNNWSPEITPMNLSASGMWSVTVMLPPGTYSYKFLIDRKQKLPDPTATGSEPDGFGGTNSVIKVK